MLPRSSDLCIQGAAMSMNPKIAYHLRELDIARSPRSYHHAMPEFSTSDRVILDIGCGIGQTLVNSRLVKGKLLVGIDIDLDCLVFGHEQFDYIKFINGTAEQLPFRDNSFDFVISRVALPFTNLPQSLGEIARVLKRNGRVWFMMHPFSITAWHLKQSIRNFHIKDIIYRSYVIVNGMAFHFWGKLFSFPIINRYESFQSRSGMKKCMKKYGFVDICMQDDDHFICTARKGANNKLPGQG